MDHWDDDMYRWDRERDEWDQVEQDLLDDWEDDRQRDLTPEQHHWSHLDVIRDLELCVRENSEGISMNLFQSSRVDWKRDGF